jgi:hypothetical protein
MELVDFLDFVDRDDVVDLTDFDFPIDAVPDGFLPWEAIFRELWKLQASHKEGLTTTVRAAAMRMENLRNA